MKKNLLRLILSISCIFCIYCYSKFNNNEIAIMSLSNNKVVNFNNTTILDSEEPTIENVLPENCQQYIVSNPNIKAFYSDSSGIDTSSIKLYVNYDDVTKQCDISDNQITYVPKKKFKRGNQIVKLIVCDSSVNKNKKIYEWYFTVGTPIYNHYRGLLHSHTSASDGHGTYADAYYMARDKAYLDFFAITEHSNLLDNYTKCNLNDGQSSKSWNDLINTCNKFTSNDKFIALNGFEMTYKYNVSNPIGHINIFNSNGFVTANEPNMDLDSFYKLLAANDELIGQFNHPSEKFGTFNNFKYSNEADKVISLIEVGNGYNKEMYKNIHSHDMYQLALDKGWHLAPTCNQDNHIVDFGVANEFRTVILATNLNKDSLYDALENMRVYATQDKNVKIDYTINELPMGSNLKNTPNLKFYISVIDNDVSDKIKKIEIISNNYEIIKSKEFDSNLAKLEFTIKPQEDKFYYVKITQANNKISLTAPIWTKKR